MPMAVLLVPSGDDRVSLGPETLRQLAGLGVTDLAVLRDEQIVGLVLQGWAFDPEQSAEALQMLVTTSGDARTLLPLSQASVSPAQAIGVARERANPRKPLSGAEIGGLQVFSWSPTTRRRS